MVAMNLYWLEQTEADVPAENDWLSERELLTLNGFRVPKRRADWRLGRWTAKRAVSTYLSLPSSRDVLATIEVCPAASGAPEIFFSNRPGNVAISLSHSEGVGLCVAAPVNAKLGCDLELVAPRSEAFVTDYFTGDERALLSRSPAVDKAWLTTLFWSAKESALKALHEGLRLDTRSVIVKLDAASGDVKGWGPIQVHQESGSVFHGWWRISKNLVRTVVADSQVAAPVWLGHPCPSQPGTSNEESTHEIVLPDSPHLSDTTRTEPVVSLQKGTSARHRQASNMPGENSSRESGGRMWTARV
jgi:4'-phosphopantetheinyl transferase